MLTRRGFLKLSVTSAGTFLIVQLGGGRAFAVPLPGGTLDPRSIPKYVDAAGDPAGDAAQRELPQPEARAVDYYEIAVRQFRQQILPAGMGRDRPVWSYGSVDHPDTFNYPAFTIEADVAAAGARQVDQRPRRRRTAASGRTCCRSTRRCTGPTRPAAPGRDGHGMRPRRRTAARCRS